MRDLPAALDQFRPHPVTDVTGPKHAASRAVFERAVTDLWAILPDGPEKTLVMRKLQEASMMSNLTIALSGPAVAQATPEGGPAREYPVRDVEGPLERNEHRFRGDSLLQIPVVVHIDNRQVLMRPGVWSVPELRQTLSVSFGWDLWFLDWHNTRVPLNHSETVTVHDGQRFVTTSRKVARADAPS